MLFFHLLLTDLLSTKTDISLLFCNLFSYELRKLLLTDINYLLKLIYALTSNKARTDVPANVG